MTTQIAGSQEGHHAAARRLANAIMEAERATMTLDDDALYDGALDAVAGGSAASDEGYWASADFFTDWRTDPSAFA